VLSQRGVPHFRNSRKEFRSNCDHRESFETGLCDNEANPVINILFSPLFSSLLFRASRKTFCVQLGEESADGGVVETDIFQQGNVVKDGNHFPRSFPAEGNADLS